jgi:hypothetical protein
MVDPNSVYFAIDQMIAMAQFIAELIRQGISFETTNCEKGFTIRFTGF